MRTRAFGADRKPVPVIGQGTWNLEQAPPVTAVAALRRGIAAGMRHVDTAEMYGDGRVERLVGEAIRGRRDDVFLVSKVLPGNASRRGTVQACERSLARLGTDHLDCYLLHWPGPHPLEDTVAAFEELVRAGRIRSWGVSNFDERELERAVAIAGPGRIACNQVLYHLGERGIEHAVIPFCADHDIALVAYSPFGSGCFPPPRSRGGRLLAEIGQARNASPRQVALAFLVRHPALLAIPKASRWEHVCENAGAGRLELGEDEVRRIETAFPRGPVRRGVATL